MFGANVTNRERLVLGEILKAPAAFYASISA
jgi:hypothetical protein